VKEIRELSIALQLNCSNVYAVRKKLDADFNAKKKEISRHNKYVNRNNTKKKDRRHHSSKKTKATKIISHQPLIQNQEKLRDPLQIRKNNSIIIKKKKKKKKRERNLKKRKKEKVCSTLMFLFVASFNSR
jgi:hypothetical protein